MSARKVQVVNPADISSTRRATWWRNNEAALRADGWRLASEVANEKTPRPATPPQPNGNPVIVIVVPWNLSLDGVGRTASLQCRHFPSGYDLHVVTPSQEVGPYDFGSATMHLGTAKEVALSLIESLQPTALFHHGSRSGYGCYTDCPVAWVQHAPWSPADIMPTWANPVAVFANYPPPEGFLDSSWDGANIVASPIGVDLGEFRPRKLIAGIVGRTSKIPVSFFESLRSWEPGSWEIHIVGVDDDNKINALPPFVKWLGPCAPGDMPGMYQKFDALLHPSEHDSGSRVMVEAMASGVPVIARAVDGVPFNAGEGGGVELVGSDADMLHVLTIMAGPQFRGLAAEAARQEADARHDITKQIKAHLEAAGVRAGDSAPAVVPQAPLRIARPAPGGPNLGMVLRGDYGGLSRISEEFYHHLKPLKSLVVDVGRNNPFRAGMFPGDDVKKVEYNIPESDLAEWMDGLDTILTFETPYNWDLFHMARERGIRTILMIDYEYLDSPLPSRPDVLWMPVNWYLDDLRRAEGDVVFVPMPVDRSRFKYREKKIAQTFVAVLGHAHISAGKDRNGAGALLKAIPLVENQEVRFILRSMQALPEIDDPRVTIDVTVKENPEDNWAEGAVFVSPRRYAGMSLPMNEALSCGIPPLMTDMAPQNSILPKHWLIEPEDVQPYRLRRNIKIATVSPRTLAAKIDSWAMKDIAQESRLADQIAEEISWERMLPAIRELVHG